MSFLKNKNNNIFCFFIIVFLFLPLPFFSIVYGINWLDSIQDAVVKTLVVMPYFVIFLLSLLFLLVSTLFAFISRGILMYIISPDFINWSYTIPGNPPLNPIIQEGLKTTQSLAYMILVIALLYIGIVTILGLEGYNTKKLLTTFFLVALLVNFAPVLCGIIVDAANILMNHFLGGIRPGPGGVKGLSERTDNITSMFAYGGFQVIWSTSQGLVGMGFMTAIETIAELILLGIIGLSFAFAYLIFATLFLARYFFIWLLVILSPLAFVFYIIPQTAHLTKKWWETFTQWAFIGVTGGFFLHLAERFTEISFEPDQQLMEKRLLGMGTWMEMVQRTLETMLPLLFSIFLIYIGILATLTTNVIGSKEAMKFGRKAATFGGGVLAGTALGAAGATGLRKKFRDRAADFKTRTGEFFGKEEPGATKAQKRKRLNEAKDRMETLLKEDPEKVKKKAKSRFSSKEDRMAAAMALAEDGKLDKSDNRQLKAYKAAVASGSFDTKKAEDKDPNLVDYDERATKKTMKDPDFKAKHGSKTKEQQRKEAKKINRQKAVQRQSAARVAENLSANPDNFDITKNSDILGSINSNTFASQRFKDNLSGKARRVIEEYKSGPKRVALESRIFSLLAGTPEEHEEAVNLSCILAEIDANY